MSVKLPRGKWGGLETCMLDWELVRSNLIAAEEELVTGSKVPSNLLQLKSEDPENLDYVRLS